MFNRCNGSFSTYPQEIPLSEILQVELPGDYSNLAQGSNPHCFEIITSTMVYYVGENNCSPYHNPALAASGVGMEVAQGWEKAIRQALMPVTPQPSVTSAAGQGRDHSKRRITAFLIYLVVYIILCILCKPEPVKAFRNYYSLRSRRCSRFLHAYR